MIIIGQIKQTALKFKKFLEKNPNKRLIRVITHIDTDGLTAGSIFIKMLERMDENFWITSIKQLERKKIIELINEIKVSEWKAVVFLDLGSNALDLIDKIPCFTLVLDHHEILNKVNLENTLLVNPCTENKKDLISAAGLTYLFAREVNERNKDLAQLAVLGMVGDLLDSELSKMNDMIIKDAKKQGIQVKKGPIIFSSTRPIHKALEFSSNVFIPGVTGSYSGVLALLREAAIDYREGTGYKTLLELNKGEISRLMTAILLRRIREGHDSNILGNIYLIKLFGHLEDARELSSLINACGRLGYSDIALSFLIGSRRAKFIAQDVYNKYKHYLVKALNYAETCDKIKGQGYVIINAGTKIKDTIIGTVLTIIASSSLYPAGTILVGMAYQNHEKIKISSRISGRDSPVNLTELLKHIVDETGGDIGGHQKAAGAIIPREKENLFLELIERELKMNEISIKI
jgi:RecJ-like exonuclease